MTVELSEAQLEQLADLVAARLRPVAGAPDENARSEPTSDGSEGALVSAVALASELGVSRAFVYEHAVELGAVRLGDGPRARLRFDAEVARAALSCYASKRSQAQPPSTGGPSASPAPRRRRSLATGRPKPGSMLPARPRQSKGATS